MIVNALLTLSLLFSFQTNAKTVVDVTGFTNGTEPPGGFNESYVAQIMAKNILRHERKNPSSNVIFRWSESPIDSISIEDVNFYLKLEKNVPESRRRKTSTVSHIVWSVTLRDSSNVLVGQRVVKDCIDVSYDGVQMGPSIFTFCDEVPDLRRTIHSAFGLVALVQNP